MSDVSCIPKYLPSELAVDAARTAVLQNPCNRPATNSTAQAMILPPEHLAVLTSKYWGAGGVKLTVGFLEQTPNDLANRILAHMNAWREYANIEFVRSTTDPQVRITRAQSGYWSYLGTDILHIAKNEPTMCLEGFSMGTSEAEFRRVVRHETGHTLGFPHEHMRRSIIDRIDARKAIDYFRRTQGWSAAMVQQNVLTPLAEASIMGTPDADETSIMAYNLPALITKDGKPIIGGNDIAPQDIEFVAKVYPKQVAPPQPPGPAAGNIATFYQDFDSKTFYVDKLPAGWRVVKGTPNAGGSAVLSAPQLHALANEAEDYLVTSDAPSDAASAPGFIGVIGAVRDLIQAIRSGDLDAMRKAWLNLNIVLFGDNDGLNFQTKQAALGQRINWAKLMEWLLKVAPLVLS